MNRYFLSIGGAGHRTLGCLVHLAAAGALGDKDVRVLCVDNDATNGNLNQTLQLIDQYNQLSKVFRGSEDVPLFRLKIELLDRKPWSPFPPNTSPTLDGFFLANSMRKSSEDLAELYEFLYDPAKRSMPVTEGFRGRPSIGAAVYRAASRLNAPSGDALRSLREGLTADAAAGNLVPLLAVGSIFGGTGAAGLPTLPANLIDEMRAHSNSVLCGGIFLLPYFSFKADQLDDEGAHANPDDFPLMMKDALEYYERHPGRYDRVYVIGSDEWREQPVAAVGRQGQNNPANIVELLAAIAASDYYEVFSPSRSILADRKPSLAVLHRSSPTKFQWNDIPDNSRLKPLFRALTRFSFIYLKVFCALLKQAEHDRTVRGQAWYRHHVDAAGRTSIVRPHEVELLERFCGLHLSWWEEIHQPGGIEVDLLHNDGFRNDTRTHEGIVREMGKPQSHGDGTAGMRSFIPALYRVCRVTV